MDKKMVVENIIFGKSGVADNIISFAESGPDKTIDAMLADANFKIRKTVSDDGAKAVMVDAVSRLNTVNFEDAYLAHLCMAVISWRALNAEGGSDGD